MIRISILYPHAADARFDFDYYLATHMPRAIALLGQYPGYRGTSVERGQQPPPPQTGPAYVATCHFLFDSLADFITAFAPHAAELQGDIPRYTDITPTIQIGEVVLSHP
jgi:uncharacterized protein (TIGR02118 family)